MATLEQQQRLRELIDGYRGSALLYVAAKLRLADVLDQEPRDARQLAEKLRVDADALERVLRGLTVLGIAHEEVPGRFTLTELGAALRTNEAGALNEWGILVGEEYMPAWGSLLHTVRTGETAFDRMFGMSPWEHRRQNPALASSFNSWLREQTASSAHSILQAHDFSEAREVADVGGGHGALLTAILVANKGVRGLLVDLPHVIAEAEPLLERAGLAPRIRTHGGDFFSDVPSGADTYVLKSVLHDWDDERCQRILRNCRKAMSGSGKLLVVERTLPERAEDNPAAVMLDLHMLAILGGRERLASDYCRLAAGADLKLHQDVTTEAGFHVLEFRPV
jgi:hypothetical protein